jgi:two-component system sensor histidine kinase HydH
VSARIVQFSSLRTKLLLFAAALVVLPALVSGIITVTSTQAALSRVVGRQLTEEARNAADRLATVLRSTRESLDTAARQDVMREIRIGDLDKRISSFLTALKRGDPSCLDLAVVDGANRVVASSNPQLTGRSGDALPVPAGVASMTGPLDSPLHARRSLLIARPIPDPDGVRDTFGRLIALYDWERQTDVTARVRENLASVGLDVDVLLVDATGTLIGGSWRPGARWHMGRSLGLATGTWHAASDTDGRVDRDAGILFGTAALGADVPAWTVLVSQPLAMALAPARRTARLLTLALGGVLLVALAAALAAARRVTRPLAELTAAAERMGREGRATASVPVRSRDEIGTLAAAFNRMTVDLKRAEQELVEAAKFAFVGELAAGVAHEVRTPLGVLQSSAQLLERSLQGADDESRELLQLLRDEVQRIDHIVTGLLELGRPRPLRPEPSSLGQVVFHALDFAEAQAREKGVIVTRRPTAPDPVVLCDPQLIHQVALNLLVNAIQIVPPGGHVELAVQPVANGHASFEVRDDGPGVPPDARERIFQPFFTQREGGSGLGLTFVRRVVQEHRGRIAVEDANGRGAVFRVELPVAENVP